MERMSIKDTAGMNKRIKEIARQKTCLSTGYVKSKMETFIKTKRKKYFKEGKNMLYNSFTEKDGNLHCTKIWKGLKH